MKNDREKLIEGYNYDTHVAMVEQAKYYIDESKKEYKSSIKYWTKKKKRQEGILEKYRK